MRLYQIMYELMHAHDYLSLEYFMKKTHVSKRTLQNDISYLMQMSSRKGYQIHMRRGSGYLLEVTNHGLLQEFIASLEEESSFTTQDRVRDILAYLAIQKDYITMDQIAEAMMISRTSVKNYMNDIDEVAKHYHVCLERRSHYGVRVEGSSRHFKDLLCELYFHDNKIIVDEMKKIEEEFEVVKNILIHKIPKENLNINYNELRNVIVWLQVCIYYEKQLHRVNDDVKETCVCSDAIHRINDVICDAINTIYDIHISSSCKQEILEVLHKNIRLKETEHSFSDQLEEDINEFLRETDQLYTTSFENDEDFRRLLLTHVSLLIDRLHQKISYKNSLADEICIRYPMIFNLAIQFAEMLKEKYGVEATHDEIGFVATHFAAHMERESNNKIKRFNKIGVVCSSGGGGAYLIKMQIQSIFPNANVETFSCLNLDMLQAFEPDLIFTIMSLNQEFDAPIIYIKELLDEIDLMRIRQILQYENYDSISIEEASDYIYNIFNRNYFQIIEEGSYQEIIEKMAQQVEDDGYGGEQYCAYVMERESYMTTVYLNGVAIPHPMQMCAQKNLISVAILKHDVAVNDKPVHIVFLIALTKDDYEMHKDITKRLYQLMKDEAHLQRVLNVQTYEELMIVLHEVNGGNL